MLTRISIPLFFACLGWVGVGLADTAQGFQQTQIKVETRQGRSLRFDVFLALTRDQQIKGLMHVDELDELEGMLFVYPDIRPISMWMKNTPLPLDIVFIRDDGSIARIAKNTKPYSTDSIGSGEPVRGVLELNAGSADELHFSEGDVIVSQYIGDGE